jgi:hypothetical protein
VGGSPERFRIAILKGGMKRGELRRRILEERLDQFGEEIFVTTDRVEQ